MAAISQ